MKESSSNDEPNRDHFTHFHTRDRAFSTQNCPGATILRPLSLRACEHIKVLS